MSCLQQLLKEAENLGWFTHTDGNFTSFEIYSPENQDFYFEVEHMGSVERLIDGIKSYYDSFDCSAESYLWLGKDGHGTNGAPYDMKDLYNDMEWCQASILRLYTQLEDKFNEI